LAVNPSTLEDGTALKTEDLRVTRTVQNNLLRHAQATMERQSCPSNGHPENTAPSIRASFESAGNVTVTSLLQKIKHACPRISTDEGRAIDSMADLLKASSVIRSSVEFEPKKTCDSDLQPPKQIVPSCVTGDGRQFESRPSQLANAPLSISRSLEFELKRTWRIHLH
jgi:hypothetical protein